MKLKSIIAILTATFISTSVWGGHHACDYKNKEELKKNNELHKKENSEMN